MTSSSSDQPPAPPMVMVAVPREHTAERLDKLEKRGAVLASEVDRGRRQRKLFWVALAGMTVGLVVALGLIVYLLMGRADSRRYYNDQIRMLVCAVPPGEETRDLLRERAQCGPYSRPTDLPSRSPVSSQPAAAPRSLTPTTTTTATGTARADVPEMQSPLTRTVPGATRTVRVPPTATRTARGASSTPPPSSRPVPSSSTTTGLLPDLLCTVLGCPAR